MVYIIWWIMFFVRIQMFICLDPNVHLFGTDGLFNLMWLVVFFVNISCFTKDINWRFFFYTKENNCCSMMQLYIYRLSWIIGRIDHPVGSGLTHAMENGLELSALIHESHRCELLDIYSICVFIPSTSETIQLYWFITCTLTIPYISEP